MTVYGGAIGNFAAVPLHINSLVPRRTLLQSGGAVWLNPDDYYRAFGRHQWDRRLRGHPAWYWVRWADPPDGSWRDRLIDWLLPGWRLR